MVYHLPWQFPKHNREFFPYDSERAFCWCQSRSDAKSCRNLMQSSSSCNWDNIQWTWDAKIVRWGSSDRRVARISRSSHRSCHLWGPHHPPTSRSPCYHLTGTKPSKSKYRSCVASRSPAREVRLPIRQLRGFRRRQTHSTGGPTYSIQEEAVLPRLVSQPSHIHVTRGHMTCSACAYREAPATWQVRMAKSSCTQLFHAMWMLLGSNSLCLGLLWDHEAASIRFWRASQSSVGIGCAAMLPLDGIGQIDHMMANCKYISFQQSRYLN